MTIPRNLSFLAEGASSTGVLSVAKGGTGNVTLTAGYIPYGNGTGAFNSSANLNFDGTNINVGNGVLTSANGSGGTGYVGAIGTAFRLINLNASGATQILGSGQIDIQTSGGAVIQFTTSGTERARIFASGGVSIGNTTDPGATNLSVTGTGKYGTTIGVGATTPATSGAGISFPATQSASTDVNTLDDYEEGTFTPVLTAGTPGNLSVTYGTQTGYYTKIGNLVTVVINITTTAFTWTTASGQAIITGLPFTVNSGAFVPFASFGGCSLGAGYTQVAAQLVGTLSNVYLSKSGSGVGLPTALLITDFGSGNSVALYATFSYFAA
jgi:hypothetical protein